MKTTSKIKNLTPGQLASAFPTLTPEEYVRFQNEIGHYAFHRAEWTSYKTVKAHCGHKWNHHGGGPDGIDSAGHRGTHCEHPTCENGYIVLAPLTPQPPLTLREQRERWARPIFQQVLDTLRVELGRSPTYEEARAAMSLAVRVERAKGEVA